jgi:hypothetical protein
MMIALRDIHVKVGGRTLTALANRTIPEPMMKYLDIEALKKSKAIGEEKKSAKKEDEKK